MAVNNLKVWLWFPAIIISVLVPILGLFMEGFKLMALITVQRTSKIWDRFVQNPKEG